MSKNLPIAASLALALGLGVTAPATADNSTEAATIAPSGAGESCRSIPIVVGGVNLGCLPEHLFVFGDGSGDANWQASSKGYVGNVAVMGTVATERTSGSFAYAGTIATDDHTLGAWSQIVAANQAQASTAISQAGNLMLLEADLREAISQIEALPVSPGFDNRSAQSLDNLDTTNGQPDVTVVDVTSGHKITTQIDIHGDPSDVYVLRWDTDADPANGLNGQVKFQGGGAIVPHGLSPSGFLHIAGDINASGGGSTPAAPFPQGPRLANGNGPLIHGGKDFSGGGFFTGYWFTTGRPDNGATAPLGNAIFVGGWYTLSTKLSMTSGTSGVHIAPPPSGEQNQDLSPPIMY